MAERPSRAVCVGTAGVAYVKCGMDIFSVSHRHPIFRSLSFISVLCSKKSEAEEISKDDRIMRYCRREPRHKNKDNGSGGERGSSAVYVNAILTMFM